MSQWWMWRSGMDPPISTRVPNISLSQNRKTGGLLSQVIWQKQPKEKLEGNLAHKYLNRIESYKMQKQVPQEKSLVSGERDQNEPASHAPL